MFGPCKALQLHSFEGSSYPREPGDGSLNLVTGPSPVRPRDISGEPVEPGSQAPSDTQSANQLTAVGGVDVYDGAVEFWIFVRWLYCYDTISDVLEFTTMTTMTTTTICAGQPAPAPNSKHRRWRFTYVQIQVPLLLLLLSRWRTAILASALQELGEALHRPLPVVVDHLWGGEDAANMGQTPQTAR